MNMPTEVDHRRLLAYWRKEYARALTDHCSARFACWLVRWRILPRHVASKWLDAWLSLPPTRKG